MNFGKVVSEMFAAIAQGFNPIDKLDYPEIEIKSDKEALQDDWNKVGESFDFITKGGDRK